MKVWIIEHPLELGVVHGTAELETVVIHRFTWSLAVDENGDLRVLANPRRGTTTFSLADPISASDSVEVMP